MATKNPLFSKIDYCVEATSEKDLIQIYCPRKKDEKNENFEPGIRLAGIVCCFNSEGCPSTNCLYKNDINKLAVATQ